MKGILITQNSMIEIQRKCTVKLNVLITHNTALHDSVHQNHHQVV